MASTGTALFPSASTFPGTTVYPGQGLQPIARCRLSFDDVVVTTPNWTEVTDSDFRSFSISRGRDGDFEEVSAGTATVVLDNRDRSYDPNSNSSIRPLNRIWLYEEFSGETHDLFKGYVQAWDQGWPGGGWSDSIVTLACADELMVLSLESLPTTNPPRDSYQSMIAFDGPDGYWPMGDDLSAATQLDEPQDSPDYTILEPLTGTYRARYARPWWQRGRRWPH